jgi:hypothetical protein
MANGYLIIDGRKDGLPDAAGYYRTFPREPSPLGDLALSASKTSVMGTSSLDTALGEMPKAGAGGIVVLVCHAYQDGMLLPVAPGGSTVWAVVKSLGTIDQINSIELDVAQIRQMPSKKPEELAAVLERWKKLFESITPGSVGGTFTIPEAEKLYGQWLDQQARSLEFSGSAALRQMLAKLRRVRQLKLSRLELRACNIGKSPPTMEVVRKFFGADHLTAPTLGTFYMSPIPVATMAARARASGGPVAHGVAGTSQVPGPTGIGPVPRDPTYLNVIYARQVMAKSPPSTRGFYETAYVGYSGWNWSIPLGRHYRVLVTVVETRAYHYQGWASVVSTRDMATPDWSLLKSWFVDAAVMPNSGYSRGPFPLAGFWNPDLLIKRGLRGDVSVPFVLPNDMVYTELIAQVP